MTLPLHDVTVQVSSVDDDGYMAAMSAQMGISAAEAATAIEEPEVVVAWDRAQVLHVLPLHYRYSAATLSLD